MQKDLNRHRSKEYKQMANKPSRNHSLPMILAIFMHMVILDL